MNWLARAVLQLRGARLVDYGRSRTPADAAVTASNVARYKAPDQGYKRVTIYVTDCDWEVWGA